MLVHIANLIDEAKCFETVRQLRWPDGVTCPHCASHDIAKDGRYDTQTERQRYLCHAIAFHARTAHGPRVRSPVFSA